MILYYYQGDPVEFVRRYKDKYVILHNDVEKHVAPKTLTKRYAPNPDKRVRKFEENFGSVARVQAIKMEPCVVCGRIPSENAHVVNRSQGGTAKDIVPMCRLHHLEYDADQKAFVFKYNIDLTALAAEYTQKYPVL